MRTFRRGILLLGVVCLMATGAQAVENVTRLGCGYTGRPYALNDGLMLEDYDESFVLRDFTVPDQPVALSGMRHFGVWRDVVSDGDLFIGLREGLLPGFEIISVSDPAHPQYLGAGQILHFTSGWLNGNVCYLATTDAVVTWDISDPTQPDITSYLPVGTRDAGRGFFEVDGILYFLDEDQQIRGFDLTDPLHPVDLGTTVLNTGRIDGLIGGEHEFHVVHLNEPVPEWFDLVLDTFDVSAPMTFSRTERSDLDHGDDGQGLSLALSGSLLLVGLNTDEVWTFGMDDPLHPEPGIRLLAEADRVAVNESVICIYEDQQLQVYERTAHTMLPPLLQTREALPLIYDLIGNGPVVWAQPWSNCYRLIPVDVSDPWQPEVGPPFGLPMCGSLAYYDGLAVVSGNYEFQLVDLSDPDQPTLCAHVNGWVPIQSHSYLASGVAAFDGPASDWISLFDVSDIDEPVFAARIERATEIYALGDDFLICEQDGPRIYDIADCYYPRAVDALPLNGDLVGAAIDGKKAYVVTRSTTDSYKLSIVYLDEAEVVWNQPLELSDFERIAVNGSRLHVVGDEALIFSLTEPYAPVQVGSYEASGPLLAFAGEVFVNGPWLQCLSDDTYLISPVDEPVVQVATGRLSLHPNPFNAQTSIAFDLKQAEDLSITIFDVRGRFVTHVGQGTYATGHHSVTWNGTDQTGSPVASGVYYVRLNGERTEAVGKLALVK